MKILITGRSGAGKTMLLPALQERGFTVYNTDDMPEISRFEDMQSHEPVKLPKGYIDWKKIAFRWQAEPLRKLLDSTANVAIAAVMANQKDFYGWFNLRFVITIDTDALSRHWQHSSSHHKDMDPANLERAVALHNEKQQHFIDDGCIPISGDRPIAEMANDIMRVVDEHGGMAA
jgi:hypothetical protein